MCWKTGILLLLFVTLTGCTTSRSIFDPPERVEVVEVEEQDVYADFERALRTELEPWHGTPHVWGGNSKQGVDCSGLVTRIYADVLDVDVARTTSELIKAGRRVSRKALLTGDLVFFTPEKKKGGHVGIYLSDGQFTHASSSAGVTTSNLSDTYWSRVYETSRRVVQDREKIRKALLNLQERQKLARGLQSE